ncbi:DUF3237 family protein [Streptomyces sp. NPDC058877]|uniref:DUF3237 family protein n=1 Tax=unclassified Streptomyces TaxID=2593676 RepID=UPI0036C2C6F6
MIFADLFPPGAYCRPEVNGPDRFDGRVQASGAGTTDRISLVFRTDAPAHRWLTETVFVGLARPDGDEAVVIRMYALR